MAETLFDEANTTESRHRQKVTVAGLVQQHKRGGQDKPVYRQRKQPSRRAVLAVRPAQPADVGLRHHRREGGHGADQSRRRGAVRECRA